MYESGKLILTCNGVFVGKGYFSKGMVKLSTIENIFNKVSIFAYMIESIYLWHSRLTRINIRVMKRLIILKNVKFVLILKWLRKFSIVQK